MHPRTEELLRHLDAHRVTLRAAVDAIPPSLRDTRPSPDRWSVAETLEHLAHVEGQLTRLLTLRLSEAQAAGSLQPETDTSPVAGMLDHALIVDRRRQITAGERVIPRGEMDAATALATLGETRTALRELIVAHDGLSIGVVSHPHPAFGPIDGYQWFLFVGSHEARHADQIREIASQLRG